MMRATVSVEPPAENGTIIVIGLLGYCAADGAGAKAASAVTSTARARAP